MPKLHLFEAFGIELEYMIVDDRSLEVAPVSDALLRAHSGNDEGEAVFDDVTWSNELVLHVVELKSSEPAPELAPLLPAFQSHIRKINAFLAGQGKRLLPGPMHPWMDPFREMKLWPHDNSPIYRTFDRIFDCRGHGWANLQSMHINLPFSGDEEFARLHAAIRLVLPLLPALAAGSPVMDGRTTGFMDNRLRVYRGNSARIPSIAGSVIPEAVFSEAAYDREIFAPIRRDIAPHDPEGILEHEWLNARGAIARFSRGSIEIRIIDVQECPGADLAIASLVIDVIRALCAERWIALADQRTFSVAELKEILWATIDRADEAVIANNRFFKALGCSAAGQVSVADVWRDLAARTPRAESAAAHEFRPFLDTILREGPLARRLLKALGSDPTRERQRAVYTRLADCLQAGIMFHA